MKAFLLYDRKSQDSIQPQCIALADSPEEIAEKIGGQLIEDLHTSEMHINVPLENFTLIKNFLEYKLGPLRISSDNIRYEDDARNNPEGFICMIELPLL